MLTLPRPARHRVARLRNLLCALVISGTLLSQPASSAAAAERDTSTQLTSATTTPPCSDLEAWLKWLFNVIQTDARWGSSPS